MQLGGLASEVGYGVIFSSKNKQHAEEAGRITGKNSSAESVHDAVEMADMVLLAVPYGALKEILPDLGPLLNVKVLIDLTNALSSYYNSLTLGFSISGAEEI